MTITESIQEDKPKLSYRLKVAETVEATRERFIDAIYQDSVLGETFVGLFQTEDPQHRVARGKLLIELYRYIYDPAHGCITPDAQLNSRIQDPAKRVIAVIAPSECALVETALPPSVEPVFNGEDYTLNEGIEPSGYMYSIVSRSMLEDMIE